MNKKLLVGIAAAVGVVSLTLAGCSSGGTASPMGDDTPVKGGTVTWLDIVSQFTATDPVGVYPGEESAGLRRLVYRGLTALPITDDPNPEVVPDLATDTGTTQDEGRTWSFTLKDGVKWQDATPITCEDLQYGLARSYDMSLWGPGGGVGTAYLAQYGLYDPAAPDYDLASEYTGPLSGTAEAQAHFDNAASCDGNTITYHFKQAWPDFPYATAALFTADPYEESFDKGQQNLWTVNSNGPYMLDGTTDFDPNTGGTFVRNPNYDASTDSADVRGAYPDVVKLEIVADQETVTERLIADTGDDQAAFTPGNIPASKYSEITDALSSRTVTSPSPYTRFIEINYLTLSDPDVRRALQLATDKEGVIQALGGENYGTPSSTIISESIPGFQENPSTKDDDPAGDPEAAKKLLDGRTPTIRFAFSDTPSWGQVASVLEQSWSAAGFQVQLVPVPPTARPDYRSRVMSKDKPIDAFMGAWSADWSSLFPVVAPTLQSNPADATDGVGFNYGFYSNPEVDAAIAEATSSTDRATQQADLLKADQLAAADGAYIPLVQEKNYFIHGSRLGGFLPDAASGYYPDLGGMYVRSDLR